MYLYLEVALCSNNNSVLVLEFTFYNCISVIICVTVVKSESCLRKLNHVLKGLDKEVLELRTKYVHAKCATNVYIILSPAGLNSMLQKQLSSS